MKKKDIVHDIHQVIKDLKEYDHSVIHQQEKSGGKDDGSLTESAEYRSSSGTMNSFLRD